MKYDRYSRKEGTSWAFWQFNDYETQINGAYWTGVAAISHASYEVRHATPPTNARALMHATGRDALRFPSDKKAFISNLTDFLKWNRASFIVAATGALETYSWRIVLTALMSDPAAAHGKSRVIDGASWLKIGLHPNYSDIKKLVTKGTWQQRYSALQDLFGDIPKLELHLQELDRIRKFRNNVGHAFGRDLDAEPILTTRIMDRMRSINEQQFKDWLSVISQAAKAIDETLIANHIGDFEPMLHFHHYYQSFGETKPPIDIRFIDDYKLQLAHAEGHSKGRDYARTLIDAYLKA